MYCPKCGNENPDDTQSCNSCGSPLAEPPTTVEDPDVRISGLAIASCVFGLLSFLAFYLTAFIDSVPLGYIYIAVTILAVAFGIIGLVHIGINAGRFTGSGLAATGIIIAVLPPFLVFVRGVFHRRRSVAFQTSCASNLSQTGKATLIYASDYEGQFPRAGGRGSIWGRTPNWQANDRFTAFSVQPDRAGGQASISASLFLLAKYQDVPPKSFLCKGDINTTEFIPARYGVRDKDLLDLWDFGPSPARHCSYSYHMPYGLYTLNTSRKPGMAVAADRNPWIDSPAAKAKNFSGFKPDIPPWNGTIRQARYGNSLSHQEEGQNVLLVDSHVEFAERPYCAVGNDNIHTSLPQGRGRPEVGEPPVRSTIRSLPGHRNDSLLVHDPP